MPAADPASASMATSLRAGWYAVGVLWLGYICSFVDRQVLALLVEPIKATLQIGDTQVSLLQGLAFGLFYAIMGLPCGLLVAALLLTVREPARRNEGGASARGTYAWSAAWAFMAERRGLFLRHYGAFALFSWLAYAMLSWAPALFIRAHGWTLPETGWRFGLVYLSAGFGGAVCGGVFAAHLRRRGAPDANLRAAAWGVTVIVPAVIAAPLMPDPWLALALLGIAIFLTSFPSGASVTAISEVTPSALRGQVSAAYYLVMSVVGLIAGPLSVALCTDYLFHDPKRVGDSMALVSAVVAPAAALILWTALPQFRRWVAAAAPPARRRTPSTETVT